MIIDPECYKPDKSIFFVRPNGTYLPCCYVSTNNIFEKMLGPELYDQLNLNKYSIDEIHKSQAWMMIKNMIESDNPVNVCKNFCKTSRDTNKDLAGNKIIRMDNLNNIKL